MHTALSTLQFKIRRDAVVLAYCQGHDRALLDLLVSSALTFSPESSAHLTATAQPRRALATRSDGTATARARTGQHSIAYSAVVYTYGFIIHFPTTTSAIGPTMHVPLSLSLTRNGKIFSKPWSFGALEGDLRLRATGKPKCKWKGNGPRESRCVHVMPNSSTKLIH